MELPWEDARSEEYGARAHRTLDVAGDLLTRWGYDRVTVGEIARRAEIGKGTLYLHWKTKDELFGSLLLRDQAVVLSDLIYRLRDDSSQVLLHRVIRHLFLTTMRRPLCKALVTGDTEVLGRLAVNGKGTLRDSRAASQQARYDYLRLLTTQGLFRAEPDDQAASYALEATAMGFCHLEGPNGGEQSELPLQIKADALATVVQRAFEPAVLPAGTLLGEVAEEAAGLFERALGAYLDAVPALD